MLEEFYSGRADVTWDGIGKQGAVLLAGGCITSIGSRFFPSSFLGCTFIMTGKSTTFENLIELHTAGAGIPDMHKSREDW